MVALARTVENRLIGGVDSEQMVDYLERLQPQQAPEPANSRAPVAQQDVKYFNGVAND